MSEDEDEVNHINEEEDGILDIVFHGDKVLIPLGCLHPCPLIFYQNKLNNCQFAKDVVIALGSYSIGLEKKIAVTEETRVSQFPFTFTDHSNSGTKI